jgi:hypothetical protein
MRTGLTKTIWGLGVLVLPLLGCEGKANFQLPDGMMGPPTELPTNAEVGVSGIRRLTRVELDATLNDLLGDTTGSAQRLLPPDSADPFDNDYRSQLPSAALIESIEQLAVDTATRTLADSAKRAKIVPCAATGPSDTGCLNAVISSLGRRVLRRPLTDAEIANYATLQKYAIEANSFDVGVKLLIRALVQEPEFLYRVEVGTPVDGKEGISRLGAYEMATRLSFFLWGTTPPDWLLDSALNGELSSKDGVRAAASKLLADPRARARIERFHALWLGYHRLPHSVELTAAMQDESAALVDKVVFEDKSDYFELFRSNQSFLNSTLATHYGITGFTGGTGSAWTPYGAAKRKGLLSHGSVLSAGAKFADTSPTQRGIFVRTRLLCTDVPPPPANANVDEAPTSTVSNCKVDRYASHASVGNCKSCHDNLDPIGFGIENYNRAGQYRATDDNEPTCTIAGKGKITGLPAGDLAFEGINGLSDLLMDSGRFEQCIVTQVFRFAAGRREAPADLALLENLTTGFKTKNRMFAELLLDYASDDTFAFRKEEAP